MFNKELAKLAAQIGVKFLYGREISRLVHDGRRIQGIEVGGQQLSANQYVLAMGS